MKRSSFAATKSAYKPKKTALASAIQTSLVAATIAQGSANAASITVDSITDDGRGCTLREAIASVQAGGVGTTGCIAIGVFGEGDTVVVDPRLSGESIALVYGEIEITTASTITLQASDATIVAANASSVFDLNNADLVLSNTTLTGGSRARGGAIQMDSSSLKVYDSTFRNNSASTRGGAIYANDSTLNITNSTITDNTSAGQGGGISFYESSLTFNSITVSNNVAGDTGGGVYGYYGSHSLANSSFTNNTGVGAGGIYFARPDNLQIDNCIISGNTSSTRAGGVNIEGASTSNKAPVSISNSTISNNTAASTRGGGLHAQRVDIQISDTTINGNTSSSNGGGGYFSNSTVNMANNEVSNNSSQRGGGLYLQSSDVLLAATTVRGNQAGFDGGGIYTKLTDLSVTAGSTVADNTATIFSGGGISVEAGSSLILFESTIANNNSYEGGGGIYSATATSLDIRASTIEGNQSTRVGGGMSIKGASGEIQNSTVSSNTAASVGGLNLFDQATITLSNATVFNNKTTYDDGEPNIANLRLDQGSFIDLSNSIVAGAVPVDDYDCGLSRGSSINGDSASIIQDGSCATPARAIDPILQPLADNGGFTRTHALASSSPARDTGILASCTTNDQRGRLRDTGDGLCDVGAIEFNASDGISGFHVIPIPGGKLVVVPE